MALFFRKRKPTLPRQSLTDGVIRLALYRSDSSQYCFRIVECAGGRPVGYCDLRVGHSPTLYYYGNIGYRVMPEYRGHGYAGRASRLLLDLAGALGMNYLLITVSPGNEPSIHTCEKLGGRLEGTVSVPSWHPLYAMGEYEKLVYRYDLTAGRTAGEERADEDE
jgi:tagatose 1,6-diphosphate aldolase